ncbi:phage tail tape measure protein [Arthrobacter sp. R-11]|uniref:phage tail tape measure protein n=1 Tax=Arthrobacter sp. R-11 TaxID=3404053 RepID=UPI003CFA0914
MSERLVLVRIKAEISDFRKQMKEATQVTEKLGETVKESSRKTSKPLDETAKKAAEVREGLLKAGEAAQKSARGLGLSYDATGQLRDEFGRMVTGAKAAALGLEATSEATREYAAEQQHATDVAGRATTGLGKMAQSAARHEELWTRNGQALLAFGASAGIGLGLAIKSYMDFDRAMSEAQAATHASGAEMELLRAAAIRAGADTAFSAREAAQGITELSKAGVSTRDILTGGLDGALALAAAGAMEVKDAAELAATGLKQFKLDGADLPHVADLLAAGAGKAQGSVHDLGMALSQGGLVAKSTGLNIEETTAGLAAFASAGLLGSDAGTSFKTMLQSLTPNSAAAASEMERLGIHAYDSEGRFVGLAKFAGILQQSMKGLTDEQRQASMKIIFGSDAVRAANVLYEQGAKGITEWTEKVNDAGYAAETAALMQDNLAGDLEKLSGSIDSTFLKSGSGANDVLRSLTRGAEGLVDLVGQIPEPMLNAAIAFAGATTASALLGGSFMTMLPKYVETKRAWAELRTEAPALAGGLKAVGVGLNAVAAAATAVAVIEGIGTAIRSTLPQVETYVNTLKVKTSGAPVLESLFPGSQDTEYITANMERLTGSAAEFRHTLDSLQDLNSAGIFSGPAKALATIGPDGQRVANMETFNKAIAQLVDGGDLSLAQVQLKGLKESAKLTDEDMLGLIKTSPELEKSLTAVATKAGIDAKDGLNLAKIASGELASGLADGTKAADDGAAATGNLGAVSEEAAKRLEDMGLRADGTKESLSKLLDAMFRTGLAAMSARDAEAAYQEALDGLDKKIGEVMGTQSAGNAVWDKAKGSFDLTSEAGRAANQVFGELQQKAINTTQAMADAGAEQPELQKKLSDTYTSLYDTAFAFSNSKEKADDLARAALGIPEGVPIKTAIDGYAETMAKLNGVETKANGLDGKTATVKVTTIQDTINRLFNIPDAGSIPDGIRAPNIPKSGGATGGRVSELLGFAGGGKVPGRAPVNLARDNVLATVNGRPFGLQSEEWVINGRSSKKYDRELAAINAGTFPQGGHEVPSKSLAGGYGAARAVSGGLAAQDRPSVTFAPQITVQGAADTGAVVQEVWGKFRFEAQKAGLRIGGE